MADSKYTITKEQEEALALLRRDKTQDKEKFTNIQIGRAMFASPRIPMDIIKEFNPERYKQILNNYDEDNYKTKGRKKNDKINNFIKKMENAGFIEDVIEKRRIKQIRKNVKRKYSIKNRKFICKRILPKAPIVDAEFRLQEPFTSIQLNVLNCGFFEPLNARALMVNNNPNKSILDITPNQYVKLWLIPYLYNDYDKKKILDLSKKLMSALVEPEKYSEKERFKIIDWDKNYPLFQNNWVITREFSGNSILTDDESYRLVDFDINLYISFYIALKKYYKKEVDALDKKMLKLLGLI